MKKITDKQRLDFLDSLGAAPTHTDITISPRYASFRIYLRGNRHMPGNENNIPQRIHAGVSFREMIDDAILTANA
jgi:hypothetical protein